jgi:HD-GYP domain-containing protein (c-di-GMP phosphodiesterase class II)
VAAAGLPLMGGPSSEAAGNGLLPAGGFLCLPIKVREDVLGVMLVGDKRGGLPFQGDDLFLARFLLQKAAQAVENVALYEAMAHNLRGTLDALVKAMEAKDPHFLQHSQRVTDLAVATARALQMDQALLESLRFASYLHDVGKIGIKDDILLKEDRLDPEEYEQVKRHPLLGESIVGSLDLSPEERDVVLFHHERLDGSGYPQGLAGEDIPLAARVVAVADAFDAMTSERAYRPGKSRQQAIKELRRLAGSKFDTQVVEAFLKTLELYQPSEQTTAPEPPWQYFRRRSLAKNG